MLSKDFKEITKILPMVGQVGLSIVVPIVLCVLICSWITTKTGVGQWVYIPGFVFGLGAAFMSMYKLYTSNKKKNESEKKKTVAFNSHQ